MNLLSPLAIPRAWLRRHSLPENLGSLSFFQHPSNAFSTLSCVAAAQDQKPEEMKPASWKKTAPKRSSSAGATILPLLRAAMPDAVDDIPRPRPGRKSLSFTSPRAPKNRLVRRVHKRLKDKDDSTIANDRGMLVNVPNAGSRIANDKGLTVHLHRTGTKNGTKMSLAHITAMYINRFFNMTIDSKKGHAQEQVKVQMDALSPFLQHHTARLNLPPYLEHLLPIGAEMYIKERGYSASQLPSWMYVLLGKTGGESLTRLRFVYNIAEGKVPVFLISHSLRRQRDVSHVELEDVITLLRDYLDTDRKYRTMKDPPKVQGRHLDTHSMDVIIIRLLRLAYRYSPYHLPAVIQLVVDYRLVLDNSKSVDQITHLCNQILYTLAAPTIGNAYTINLQYSLKAQFELLTAMSKSTPPLLLTRTGFRGLARTQLAMPKTEEDKERVRSMSKSWPPYRKERDGWNDQFGKGNFTDQNLTTAGLVLQEMEKAGYAMQAWEEAAMVLAGRDTDHKPTIPTRTFFRPSQGHGSPELVYVARIQATRTIHEAWAIFEMYLHSDLPKGGPKNGGLAVYHIMFQKLVSSQKKDRRLRKAKQAEIQEEKGSHILSSLRQVFTGPVDAYQPATAEQPPVENFTYSHGTLIRGPSKQESLPQPPDPMNVVAGDRVELQTPPMNPAEAIHTSTPTPTVGRLWAMMAKDGIRADTGILASIISLTRKRSTAMALLDHWHAKPYRLSKKYIPPFRWWAATELNVHKATYKEWPKACDAPPLAPFVLVRAFISVLTANRKRHPRIERLYQRDLPHAMDLLAVFKLHDIESYKYVLKGLIKLPSVERYKNSKQEYNPTCRSIWTRGRVRKEDLTSIKRYRPSKQGKDHTQLIVTKTHVKKLSDVQRYQKYEQGQDQTHQHIWAIYTRLFKNCGRPDSEVIHLLLVAALKDLTYRIKTFYLTHDWTEDWPESILHDGYWGGKPPIVQIISLFTSRPQPMRTATIHAYLRLCLLTAYDDYAPVVSMVRFICARQDELETKNRRLPIIAIHAFLNESGVRDTHTGNRQSLKTSAEKRKQVLVEVRNLVNGESGLAEWGGGGGDGGGGGGGATSKEAAAYRGQHWPERDELEDEDEEDEEDDEDGQDGEDEGDV